MKWLTENLAVGNSADGLNEKALIANGITATLNVAWDLPQPVYEVVLGRKAGLIHGLGNSLEAFAEAANLLASLLSLHSRVLVYCYAGIDRSPFVAAAALAATRGWDTKRAFQMVKTTVGVRHDNDKVEEDFHALLRNYGNHKASTLPFVSIVMPCYNRPETTARCVESIKEGVSYSNYELVGVNDGSTDKRVQEYLEQVCDKTVTHSEQLGAGAARQSGNNAATGVLICQIDNDCVFFQHWLKNLVEGFLYHERGYNARIYGALLSCTLEYFIKNPHKRVGRGCIEVGEIGGACMLYRKTLLSEVGDFDPELYNFMEDKDLCLRVKRETVGRIFIDPSVIVYHGGRVEPETGFWSENPESTRWLPELRDKKREKRAAMLIKERWGEGKAIVC